MRLLNNWKPEVRSLIRTLLNHGFEVTACDDGEERIEKNGRWIKVLVEHVTGCDEGALYAKHRSSDRDHWIKLVLGNEPGAIVCDYSILIDKDCPHGMAEGLFGKYAEANAALDWAANEHATKWEGRKQPKVEEWKVYACRKCGKKHRPSAGQTCLEATMPVVAGVKYPGQ